LQRPDRPAVLAWEHSERIGQGLALYSARWRVIGPAAPTRRAGQPPAVWLTGELRLDHLGDEPAGETFPLAWKRLERGPAREADRDRRWYCDPLSGLAASLAPILPSLRPADRAWLVGEMLAEARRLHASAGGRPGRFRRPRGAGTEAGGDGGKGEPRRLVLVHFPDDRIADGGRPSCEAVRQWMAGPSLAGAEGAAAAGSPVDDPPADFPRAAEPPTDDALLDSADLSDSLAGLLDRLGTRAGAMWLSPEPAERYAALTAERAVALCPWADPARRESARRRLRAWLPELLEEKPEVTAGLLSDGRSGETYRALDPASDPTADWPAFARRLSRLSDSWRVVPSASPHAEALDRWLAACFPKR
jgi:hypothetical protein